MTSNSTSIALSIEEEQELLDLLIEEQWEFDHAGFYNKYFHTEEKRQEYLHWINAFNVTKDYKQIMALCANQVGKTTFGLCYVVMSTTGIYPDWYDGYKFESANTWWLGGVSQKDVRDVLQERLLGPVGDFGSGFLPHKCIEFETLKDAQRDTTPIGTFRVKHKNGGHSTVTFKSYAEGREAWQAKPGISILLDEEPPIEIYVEALMRTIASDGRVLLTFTPMKGVSDTITNFLGDHDILHPTGEVGPGRYLVRASWDDAPHLSEEAKNNLIQSIPKFQRDARSKGIPSLGAGAIYRVSEELVFIEPFALPPHWKRSYGMDVGWNRTSAIWGAIDPDSGIHYIYSEHYLGEEKPTVHTQSIMARGKWMKGAIDPAARGRGQDDGQKLFDQYCDLGLNLTKANNAVSGPLWEIEEAMEQGRFKIFKTCTNILSEFRLYRRDEKGAIVKKDDHAMDALRYWWNTGRDIASTEKEETKIHLGTGEVAERFKYVNPIRSMNK